MRDSLEQILDASRGASSVSVGDGTTSNGSSTDPPTFEKGRRSSAATPNNNRQQQQHHQDYQPLPSLKVVGVVARSLSSMDGIPSPSLIRQQY